MKKTLAVLGILIAIAVFTNIQANPKKKENKISIQNVFGNWELTKQSAKKHRNNKDIVKAFILKNDTTAMIQLQNPSAKEIDGTWKYKVKKDFGKSIFKVSFETDVVLKYWESPRHSRILGFRITEKNGEIYLNNGSIEYEKTNKP